MLKIGSSKSFSVSRWTKPGIKVSDVASGRPVTCRQGQKVKDVLSVLASRYRRLPVLDREGRLRGMIASTDVLRHITGTGRKGGAKADPLQSMISTVMNSHVLDIDANMTLPDCIEFFKKHRRGAYPVTHRKRLSGMVSEWDIVRQVRSRTGVRVEEIMVRKPIVAQDGHGVDDVAKMLSMGGFRRLPVVKNGILMGVVTPRDILRFLHDNGLEWGRGHRFPVSRVIRESPVSITPRKDAYEAATLMISKKIGGLPVVEDQEVVGIVTERDIVDALEP